MVESQKSKFIDATKFVNDGNILMARENYDDAIPLFKQAADWYEKALNLTTDPNSHETLLILKCNCEHSLDLAQQKKLLIPYKNRINKQKQEKNKIQEMGTFHKIDSKVNIK